MTAKRRTKLPRVEVLMIFIFFGCVAIWAVSKCSEQRSSLEPRSAIVEEEEGPAIGDTVFLKPQEQVKVEKANQDPVDINGPKKTDRPVLQNPELGAYGSALYCTVENLNVRAEPKLGAEVVATLKKDEKVLYLNEKTAFTQEINLGDGPVTDYWVKVRTKGNKTGWVFGAGVHYYPK